MIHTKDIIALATHITKRGKGIREHRSMYPVREWLIGLTFMTLFFIAGSVYAGALFYAQLRSFETPVVVDAGVVQYEQERVLAAIETYRHRAAQFEALREREGVPVITYATTTPDVAEEAPAPEAEAESTGPLIAE